MRLGEIKQIVDRVIDENGVIVISSESVYGGQAFDISNYADAISALEILKEQDWNDLDYSPIESITKKHPPDKNESQLTQDEFSQLNTYVASLNTKLPYFVSILSSMVEEQDEKVINIKLSDDIKSLSDLNSLNKRLETIFKIFKIDGEFELKGFDKGTDWYVVSTIGYSSYLCLILGLDIAKRFFETKEVYFKSKKAELDYKASLEKNEKYSDSLFLAYREKRLELEVEEDAIEASKKIADTNGKTAEELQSHIILGVKELVKELGEGTEFHLSLNPPEYVEGQIGSLRVDYKKVQQIRAESDKMVGKGKVKELLEPKEDNSIEGIEK